MIDKSIKIIWECVPFKFIPVLTFFPDEYMYFFHTLFDKTVR